jgi:lipopolysaccharide export LptBFGC system permease protein LptF
MDRRFTALRVIGTILKILAWIVLILGVLAALASLFFGFTLREQLGISGVAVGGPLAGIVLFVVILIFAILDYLFLYAAGEFLFLFLSIEENSRRTAYFVQQQYTASQGGYPPSPMPVDYED